MHGFLVALFMVLMAGHAASQETSLDMKAQAQAVREVVHLQINALADDDAEKAYSLTTSATQQLLGSPNNLLSFIKDEFAPIYRPRHAMFQETEIIGQHALQIVQLIDSSGLIWIAIYQVELETDGKWKVDGCRLFETGGKFI